MRIYIALAAVDTVVPPVQASLAAVDGLILHFENVLCLMMQK